MRILLIDNRLDGHHLTYLTSIVESLSGNETLLFLPQKVSLPATTIVHDDTGNYKSWIDAIYDVVKQEKPDVVHFLYGDNLYASFGAGLCKIHRCSKVVVTFHQIRRDFLHDISIKRIARNIDAFVLHTESLCTDMKKIRINNTYHIEYPQFGNSPIMEQKEALAKLGIDSHEGKVLLALGGTRYDKGLDILLESLSGVSTPFRLIVAGKEDGFDRAFIEEKIKPYRNKVSLLLHFLSDEEFAFCLNAADIIVLPYRSSFDGASGPLGEGVWHYKEIVGSAHKSLGELIRNNHLGQTFECENAQTLRAALKDALLSDWQPDETYLHYRASLDPTIFQKSYMDLYRDLVGKKGDIYDGQAME